MSLPIPFFNCYWGILNSFNKGNGFLFYRTPKRIYCLIIVVNNNVINYIIQ